MIIHATYELSFVRNRERVDATNSLTTSYIRTIIVHTLWKPNSTEFHTRHWISRDSSTSQNRTENTDAHRADQSIQFARSYNGTEESPGQSLIKLLSFLSLFHFSRRDRERVIADRNEWTERDREDRGTEARAECQWAY